MKLSFRRFKETYLFVSLKTLSVMFLFHFVFNVLITRKPVRMNILFSYLPVIDNIFCPEALIVIQQAKSFKLK